MNTPLKRLHLNKTTAINSHLHIDKKRTISAKEARRTALIQDLHNSENKDRSHTYLASILSTITKTHPPHSSYIPKPARPTLRPSPYPYSKDHRIPKHHQQHIYPPILNPSSSSSSSSSAASHPHTSYTPQSSHAPYRDRDI